MTKMAKQKHWVLQEINWYDPDQVLMEKLIRKEALLYFSELDFSADAVLYGKDIIPVGNIPFIDHWLQTFYGKHMTPIEVPECLRRHEFLERSYQILDRDQIPYGDKTLRFVKNVSKPKLFNSCLYEGRVPAPSTLPEGKYLVSGWVPILSEFRVFVFRDEILAVQPYAGNPLVFPDPEQITKMVKIYKEQDEHRPKAYTMDIAVMRKQDGSVKTIILEVHPFAACGLYGFENPAIPDMLEAGIQYYTGQ